MFTPPPSPGLPPTPYAAEKQPEFPVLVEQPAHEKQRAGRRIKWAAIVIPLILVLVTLSTRYITHPRSFDIFTGNVGGAAPAQGQWHPHHSLQRRQQSSSSSGSASRSASKSSASSSGTPTTASPSSVPSVPSSPPVLPTPFPQPWDVSLGQNFSSTSCFQFFTNMTNTLPFRACRPFSLLQLSSSAFTQAQSNLTLLNSIVWGTCETSLSEDQCVSNMNWFISGLKSACSIDLSEGNVNAIDAISGLESYKLMRTAGCAVDPNTNTYCYINAVHNSNPSDVYYYNLPLGLSMPKTAVPTCSSCTRNLMGIYNDALKTAPSDTLQALRKSYEGATEATSRSCGASFSKTPANGGVRLSSSFPPFLAGLLVLLVLLR